MSLEKKVKVNNVYISYAEAGSPDAMPVIFIHGFPFSKAMWAGQLEILKNDYRAIAYDVRGHGNSEAGADDFSIGLFADDLLAFMDELQIQKAVVCGLSMGGYIVLNAIQKQPNRFTGLILTDTQCGADTHEGREKRLKTIAFIQRNGLEIYAEESLKNLFAPASFQSQQESVKFIHETILSTSAEVVCRTLLALANCKESCSALPMIKIPVRVIVGEKDKVTPPPVAQKMVDAISGSKLVVINEAGHITNLEAPEVFNNHLLKFLGTVK